MPRLGARVTSERLHPDWPPLPTATPRGAVFTPLRDLPAHGRSVACTIESTGVLLPPRER